MIAGDKAICCPPPLQGSNTWTVSLDLGKFFLLNLFFLIKHLDKLFKVASWVLDRDVAERHPRDSDSPSSGKPTALNGDCCCSSSSQLRMANDSRSLPRSCLCSNRSGRWPSKSSRVSRQLESAGSAGGTPGKDIPAAQPLLQPTTVTDPLLHFTSHDNRGHRRSGRYILSKCS